MRKVLLIFVLLGVLLQCRPSAEVEEYKLPIPRAALVKLMIDLSIAESAASTYRNEERDSFRQVLQYQISKIHDLSLPEIDSIMKAMYYQPSVNASIQREVLDSIKAMEERSKKFKK